MNDGEMYLLLRELLEKQVGIPADLPHGEAVRRMEAYQRKEAVRRWENGECEACIGCPDAALCPHCEGDFPEMRLPRITETTIGRKQDDA